MYNKLVRKITSRFIGLKPLAVGIFFLAVSALVTADQSGDFTYTDLVAGEQPKRVITDADWKVMNPEIPGTNGTVSAVLYRDRNLYAGGSFTIAGGVTVNNIAMWDGTKWSALGSEMSYVTALASDSSGDLYAGGWFTATGGGGTSCIAKWDGTKWSIIGGVDGGIFAMAFDSSGNLYVGGDIRTAGGVPANYIAKWNRTSWSALGNGMNNSVSKLFFDSSGNLYAGGWFTTAGDVTANRIAKWNPTTSTWSALGSGMNGSVNSLASDSSGNLYAGGTFTTAGDVTANRIAKWNPTTSTWSAFGSGINGGVTALVFDSSGNLYSGGTFTTAGGVPANNIAKWNPTTSKWSALGSGLDGEVYALTFDSSGNLYAGGSFATANVETANNIAKWNPTTSKWSALGSGINGGVYSMCFDSSGNLYAGGGFTTAGGVTVNCIAKWDGTKWSALGSGMDYSIVSALGCDSSGNLYAGGGFTTAGGVPANNIAKWDGTKWSALGSGLDSIYVKVLAVDSSGNLYAGGELTITGGGNANDIAKWDGTKWSALGSGLDGFAFAMAFDTTGNLYVGGGFTTAGGVPANNIAKWDGTKWSALGSGVDGDVNALAFDSSGNLYAGGLFSTTGGVPANNIAKWDGTKWSALGSGTEDYVSALACDSSGNLYAGGNIRIAGGVPANSIAMWDGTKWSALGSGVGDIYTSVDALVYDNDGNLYVGGEFYTAGGKYSPYIAKCVIGAPSIEYTITASAGANGSISPTGTILVDSGAEQTFNIIADNGYCIADVLVDGSSVDAVATYTFTNIIANHTISANFELIPATANLTMGASPFEGGTTNPSGTSSVSTSTPINISAVKNSGYGFVNWTATANAIIADINSESTTATLEGDATIIANFTQGVLFSDSFENGLGKWTKVIQNNSQIDTSNERAHDGSYSLKIFDPGPDASWVTYALPSAQYGSWTYWWYDGYNPSEQKFYTWVNSGSLGVEIVDKGWPDRDKYWLPEKNKSGQRSIGWHKFEFKYTADKDQILIDDSLIYEKSPGTKTESFGIYASSIYNTGAGQTYYDDVKFTTTQAATDLVAYYPFNGNANDESGNGLNGTVNGASLTSDRFGSANSAYTFDGVDDFISLGNSDKWNIFGTQNPSTVSLFVKFNNLDGQFSLVARGMHSAHDGNLGNKYFAYEYLNTSSHLNCTIYNFKTLHNANTQDGLLQAGKWHHVTVVREAKMKMYIDGKDVTVPISNAGWNTDYNLVLAGTEMLLGKRRMADVPDVLYFYGAMDDIRIYNRALSDEEISALYDIANLTMAVSPADAGTTTPAIGAKVVKKGEAFTITATPASGYRFVGWTATENATIADVSATSTTATLMGDVTVTANFAEIPSTANLTMAVSPEGSGLTQPLGTATVNTEEDISIAAAAAEGYTFVNWTAEPASRAVINNANSETTTVALAGDCTMTANFAQSVALIMAVSPAGSGLTSPVIGAHTISSGIIQDITAVASSGYKFTDWTSTGNAVIGDVKSAFTTVTLTSDATVTANFEPIAATAYLTMASSPVQGGATIPVAGTSPVNTQTLVSITATANEGYNFANWSATANAQITNVISATTSVTLAGDATVTANFAVIKVNLQITMVVSPEGSGSTTPAGISSINIADALKVAAYPEDGYYFVSWSADNAGAAFADASSASTFVTVNNDTIVTANFAILPDLTSMAYGRTYGVGSSLVGLDDFAKTPKVYGLYIDPVKGGKPKKATMKVLTKIAKANSPTEVLCEWKGRITLFDKKLWDKTLTCEDNLLGNPIELLPTNLYVAGVSSNGTKKLDTDTGVVLDVVPPEIEGVYDPTGKEVYSGKAGDKLTIKGAFFGVTPPVVWMEYPAYDDLGDVKEMKCLRLKCDKVLKYKNSKDVLGKSCMDIETGLSEITVYVPSKWPKNWDHSEFHNIVIDNKVGRATIQFQTEE